MGEKFILFPLRGPTHQSLGSVSQFLVSSTDYSLYTIVYSVDDTCPVVVIIATTSLHISFCRSGSRPIRSNFIFLGFSFLPLVNMGLAKHFIQIFP